MSNDHHTSHNHKWRRNENHLFMHSTSLLQRGITPHVHISHLQWKSHQFLMVILESLTNETTISNIHHFPALDKIKKLISRLPLWSMHKFNDFLIHPLGKVHDSEKLGVQNKITGHQCCFETDSQSLAELYCVALMKEAKRLQFIELGCLVKYRVDAHRESVLIFPTYCKWHEECQREDPPKYGWHDIHCS